MRRSMNVILIVVVTCSLMLTVQHSILAQVKSKQESQGKMQKTKEIKPSKGDQTEREAKAKGDIKSEGTQISGIERYRAIIQNNLFMPLGSGGEAKREEFALIGTLGRSAIIQMVGSDRSFYVTEGQSFGNGTKLVRVGANSVTIVHEGSEKELELGSGALASQGRDAKGGGTRQRQENIGKNGKKREAARRAEKERGSGAEKGRGSGGEKQGGDTDWARKMSMDELSNVRGEIGKYIEGLRAKGVTDPEEYRGALEKMEAVEDAIEERGGSK
jgi:hypothetical protein